MMSERYLLDTCTFLWLCESPERVPSETTRALSLPESELFLSIASVWEISLKESLKHLEINMPLEQLISSAQQVYTISLMNLEVAACAQLKRLPLVHRDPFDRMLICQAVSSGSIIVTPDKKIAEYPVRTLWQ